MFKREVQGFVIFSFIPRYASNDQIIRVLHWANKNNMYNAGGKTRALSFNSSRLMLMRISLTLLRYTRKLLVYVILQNGNLYDYGNTFFI